MVVFACIKYYLETAGHRLSSEKEEKELKEGLMKKLMKDDIRSAAVGPYTIQVKLVEKQTLDKNLIPADILKRATKKGSYKKMTIRKNEGGANEI